MLKQVYLPAVMAVVVIVTVIYMSVSPQSMQASAALNGVPTIVLDAGHGGEDGGAVSASGVHESQINLAIALRMRDLLAFCGYSPVMVRETDIAVYSDGAETISEKKVSDLKNRVALVNGTDNALLVSIHQNMFSQSQYHGAQVFYAGVEGSQALAEQTQAILAETVDPSNTRQAKSASDSVFLMHNIQCPGILVECGFLSNPEEEQRLQRSAYQKQLTIAVCGSVCQYMDTIQKEQSTGEI